MAISKKLLSQDEIVVRHMHTHIKTLLPAIIIEAILLIAAVVGSFYVPANARYWALPTIWLSVLVLSIPLFVIPWIKWLTSTYTITTKRIITRHGIFTRTGHDLPLSRISDIQLEKNVDDRLFGCGTLSRSRFRICSSTTFRVPSTRIQRADHTGVLIRSGTGYSCVMFDVHGFEMTIFKLLIGIILIVLHLRLTGKQQTTQMTPIDFIGNFILGGIIGGVIYNHAISFAEYVSFLLVTFAIISGLNYAMSKFMPTRSLVMGKAYRIIENGRFTEDVLTSEDNKIDPVELLAELRGMGIFSLSEVHFLQREANGSLTVRKKGEGRVNYVLVSNGQAVADNLELAHRDEDWLRGELKQAGIGELDDLFLVELDAAGQLNIVDQEGQTTSVRISDSNAQEVTTVTEFQAPQERSATLEDVIPEDARADAAESDG